jgi:predicted SAM-dependent methyltransferase
MIQRILDMMTPPIVLKVSREILRNIRRRSASRKLAGQERLHLACGNNILEGWANIDFKSDGKVIGWDLAHGLPVRSGTIELIFCEHFIEHITLKQAKELLAECHRCLRSDGMLRLSTPSLKKVVEEYLLGRTSEWHDVGWSPATPCQMVNEGLRLWNHQFVYDDNELKRLLNEAGFREIRQVAWRESMVPGLRKLECRPFHGEVILEAIK